MEIISIKVNIESDLLILIVTFWEGAEPGLQNQFAKKLKLLTFESIVLFLC